MAAAHTAVATQLSCTYISFDYGNDVSATETVNTQITMETHRATHTHIHTHAHMFQHPFDGVV